MTSFLLIFADSRITYCLQYPFGFEMKEFEFVKSEKLKNGEIINCKGKNQSGENYYPRTVITKLTVWDFSTAHIDRVIK